MLHSGFGKRQGSGGSAAGQGRVGGTPLSPPQLLQKAASLGPAAQRSGAAAGRARLSRAGNSATGFLFSAVQKKIYLYFKEWGKKKSERPRGARQHGPITPRCAGLRARPAPATHGLREAAACNGGSCSETALGLAFPRPAVQRCHRIKAGDFSQREGRRDRSQLRAGILRSAGAPAQLQRSGHVTRPYITAGARCKSRDIC